MTAHDIIDRLGLHPHPEGGWYVETWRAKAAGDDRPSGTAILFLLKRDEVSHWHRVDAAEIWHHHAGAPLALDVSEDANGPALRHILSGDLSSGHPQGIVPAHHWQSARSLGDWSLMGCTVSPGFRFDGFELAPPGFDIPRAS